jgi:5'-nucleotidase
MHLARRRGLPALLGLTLTAGLVAIGSPARADGENTPPTAQYTLDSTAIWSGQHVKLTESGFADDTTASDAVTRTITWGDGAVETAAAGTAAWSHTYAQTGSYAVQVTLNDGELDGPGVFPAGSTVGVTTSPGTYSWRKSTIYTYPGYQSSGTMVASDMPGGSSLVWTGWDDGETSLLASGTSTAVTHWFGEGSWAPQITVQNAQGKATPRPAATLTVGLDVTAPTVTVTTPSSPSKASSWATIKGRSTDSQAGSDVVAVQLVKWNSSDPYDYVYDFESRKWVKYTGQDLPDSVVKLTTVDSAGNWQVTDSGLSKGYTLEVYCNGSDQAGNVTGWALCRSQYLSS